MRVEPYPRIRDNKRKKNQKATKERKYMPAMYNNTTMIKDTTIPKTGAPR